MQIAMRTVKPLGFAGCSLVLTAILGASWPMPSYGWSLEAHVLINRAACTTLPEPLRRFFMVHQAFIGKRGTDPNAVFTGKHGEDEKLRHRFDLDALDRFPFRDIPLDQKEALAKYGKERLEGAGLLPWRIGELYRDLVESMRAPEWERVPLVAAHLGHYVADGHEPLRTTINYDGQLTGNGGIHKRFEDELIRRHLVQYQDLAAFTQPAQRTIDPMAFTFDFLIDSYVWVDNLLRADTLASRGGRNYGDAYYAALHVFAGKLAMLSMAQAATDLGSLWYSAWIEAGRPEVP